MGKGGLARKRHNQRERYEDASELSALSEPVVWGLVAAIKQGILFCTCHVVMLLSYCISIKVLAVLNKFADLIVPRWYALTLDLT